MILNQPGNTFEYEGIIFSIGDWVQCTETSEYAGLTGIITEIRTGNDRETENPEPDIYCSFEIPRDLASLHKLEENLSSLYRRQVKITDMPLDCVIMSPEELKTISGKPDCYTPETDNPYPLCIGNSSLLCESCAYYAELDYNNYE